MNKVKAINYFNKQMQFCERQIYNIIFVFPKQKKAAFAALNMLYKISELNRQSFFISPEQYPELQMYLAISQDEDVVFLLWQQAFRPYRQ